MNDLCKVALDAFKKTAILVWFVGLFVTSSVLLFVGTTWVSDAIGISLMILVIFSLFFTDGILSKGSRS